MKGDATTSPRDVLASSAPALAGRPVRGAQRKALVLPGAGARGAYQVGVLKAIAHLLPKPSENPFSIITGTSAGAINAALLSASILGAKHPQFHTALKTFRAEQTDNVLDNPDPRQA